MLKFEDMKKEPLGVDAEACSETCSPRLPNSFVFQQSILSMLHELRQTSADEALISSLLS